MDVVVAIEVPPHKGAVARATLPPSTLHYAGTPQKFHRELSRSTAAPQPGTIITPKKLTPSTAVNFLPPVTKTPLVGA